MSHLITSRHSGNDNSFKLSAPLDAIDGNILFVESYPFGLFGQQRTLLGLIEACKDSSIDPVVAIPQQGDLVRELTHRQIPIVELPQPSTMRQYGGEVYRYGVGGKLVLARQGLGYVRSLRRFLQPSSYKAIFCNDMRGLLTVGTAARSLGLPVMIWDKLDKPHGLLDALQLPIASRNLIISNAVTSKYPNWQMAFYSNKIELVPNGIDIGIFRNACSKRKQFGWRNSDIIFAIAGSISKRKGQDRVIAVFSQVRAALPNAQLIIIGEPTGPDDESYQRQLRDAAPPGVSWLGGRDDMPEIMASIDVLVSPSRHEGMGRVNVEAMAAGKPVIGARCGGIAEVIIHGETGLLFEGDNPADLAQCMVKLGESEPLRRSYGNAGRERAQTNYNQDIQLRKVIRHMEELLIL